MSEGFAALLPTSGDQRLVKASVVFAVDLPADLHSRDARLRGLAQAQLRERIKSGGAEWEARAARLGGIVTHHTATSFPTFSMRGTEATFRSLSRLDGLIKIAANKTLQAKSTDSGPTNGVVFSEVQSYFNDYGNYAADQKVGILESFGSCRLYDEHEAFSRGATIIYPTPSATASCTTDSQCGYICGGDSRCLSGTCVNYHGTAVASVISAGRSDQGYGASGAELYHWNVSAPNEVYPGFGDTAACNKDNVADAYDWFIQNGVSLVNESFICHDAATEDPPSVAADVDGLIQDYAARMYDIVITRSAGNNGESAFACPLSPNSICVGGADLQKMMFCDSSAANPSNSDREEPDLVAFAGGCGLAGESVEVADLSATTNWSGSRGTSFAAPQIAQLVALRRTQCGSLGALGDRALLMNLAVQANPVGATYSTPGLSQSSAPLDQLDGAGVVDASAYRDCGHSTSDLNAINPLDGVEAPFDGSCEACGQALEATSTRLSPRSVDPFGPGDGRLYRKAADVPFGSTRFRASLAWHACSDLAPGTTSPATIAIDFDLFLLDMGNSRVIYSSQSFLDNNEGFDVDLTSFGSGPFEAWIGWPQGAVPCGQVAEEPIAFASTTWE